MKESRFLLIGIDGATWRVIDPLIEKGKLPNLARLMREGASGPLESTVIPNTPPAWISFMTGKNPGKTGIYDFLSRQLGTYEMKVCTSLDNQEPTIFEILSASGRRVCSVNMPMTYPPQGVNGAMISGIPLPPHAKNFCYPEGLLEEIERNAGTYIVDIDYSKFDARRQSSAQDLDMYEELLSELLLALEQRQKAILYLLEKERFDLFSLVYNITDRVQHYFWKFTDPSHPGYTEAGARRFGGTIARAYEAVDGMIGELLEAAPQYDTIVMSDHGFGPYYRDFHLNRWLSEKGYLALKKVPRWTFRRTNLGSLLRKSGMGRLSRFLPRVLRDYPLPRLMRKSVSDTSDIIWSRTKAYSNLMGISVNLKGREPEGIVTYGDDYERLTTKIMEELADLRDEKDGRKLIDLVDVKENLFFGSKVYLAADIYFMIAGLAYHVTTRLDVNHMFDDKTAFGMSGTHRMDGIAIIRANGVAAGRHFENASILDIPSTLLYLMGHPILKGMDGRVLDSIFEDGFRSRRPVEYMDDALLRAPRVETGYTPEEKEEILNLLKGLGYLG